MAYAVFVCTEDGKEYMASDRFRTQEEAEKAMNDEIFSEDKKIDGSRMTMAYVEEV